MYTSDFAHNTARENDRGAFWNFKISALPNGNLLPPCIYVPSGDTGNFRLVFREGGQLEKGLEPSDLSFQGFIFLQSITVGCPKPGHIEVFLDHFLLGFHSKCPEILNVSDEGARYPGGRLQLVKESLAELLDDGRQDHPKQKNYSEGDKRFVILIAILGQGMNRMAILWIPLTGKFPEEGTEIFENSPGAIGHRTQRIIGNDDR